MVERQRGFGTGPGKREFPDLVDDVTDTIEDEIDDGGGDQPTGGGPDPDPPTRGPGPGPGPGGPPDDGQPTDSQPAPPSGGTTTSSTPQHRGPSRPGNYQPGASTGVDFGAAWSSFEESGRETIRRRRRRGEQFGDFDWTVGGYDLERGADRLIAGTYRRSGAIGRDLFSEEMMPVVPGTEAVEMANTDDDVNVDTERAEGLARNFGVGTVQGGATAVASVPKGVMEGSEFGYEAVTNPVQTGKKVPGGVAAVGITTASQAKSSPAKTAGAIVGSYPVGLVGGRVAGVVGRGVRDRYRTAGGTEVEAEGVTGTDVLEGDESFPPARDPETYRSDPDEAVRSQAEDYTPPEVEEHFEDAGVTEGTVLKKALDVEPEGPGRGAGGFRSAPGETPDDFAYETPGSFVGPELSKHFLRTGSGGYSLRPGLPDFGGKPTGVLVKTDVDTPDADSLEGFNREMFDRAGETTAYTKPRSAVNPDEAEAIIPPEAEFSPVRGGGRLSGLARRAGFGSEFYTTIDGRRVPLRPVAPDGDGPGGDVLDAGDAAGESLDYYVDPPEPATDRPLPGSTTTGRSPSASASVPGRDYDPDPYPGATPTYTPPETEAPVSEPPVSDPPVSEPPMSDPPISPPVSEPPISAPPSSPASPSPSSPVAPSSPAGSSPLNDPSYPTDPLTRLDGDNGDDRRRRRRTADLFDDEWENPVAEAEDVMSGLFGGGD